MSTFVIQVSGKEESHEDTKATYWWEEPIKKRRYINEGSPSKDKKEWRQMKEGDNVLIYCTSNVDPHPRQISHISRIKKVLISENRSEMKLEPPIMLTRGISYEDIKNYVKAGTLSKEIDKCGSHGLNLWQVKDMDYQRVLELSATIIESKRDKWSREELEDAINAYMKMLRMEKSGKKYNKREMVSNLISKSLPTRTHGSIEYRMQNISHVLTEFGLPRIKGYLPARNVGPNVQKEIIQVLQDMGELESKSKEDYKSTNDMEELNRKANRIKKKGYSGKSPPKGIVKPQRGRTSRNEYYRDPDVKAWVWTEANGVCESCGKRAPFINSQNEPYLETHHVIPLSEAGPDIVYNVVALCPNCHKACHYSLDRQKEVNKLYKRVSRLLK